MRLRRLMDGRENSRVGLVGVEDRLLVLHLYVDHESMRDIPVRMVDLSLLFLDLLGLAAVICGREVSALIKQKRTILLIEGGGDEERRRLENFSRRLGTGILELSQNWFFK